MPAGLGSFGPMGSANPNNLEALAASGDPQAIAILQQQQAQQEAATAGAPQVSSPATGSPGIPFFNGGPNQGVSPDVAAQRAQQLIQLLRNRK